VQLAEAVGARVIGPHRFADERGATESLGLEVVVGIRASTVRASVADQGNHVVLDPLGGVYLSSVLDASKLMARVAQPLASASEALARLAR